VLNPASTLWTNAYFYQVGDTVITPIGENERQKAPVLPEPDQIPPTSTIQDHFWFAKIIYIDGDYETAHVQWFWHSSTTAMQEIFNPQELFLSLLCDTIDLRCVVGKAIVDYKPGPDSQDVKHGEFFYK
jgi:DNA (cytosine-5)-methyltransferase 1